MQNPYAAPEAGLVEYRPERPRSRYTVDAAELSSLSRHLSSYLDGCASGCCG